MVPAISSTLTDSRLANLSARAIYDSFDNYHAQFKAITRRARVHFERRDWHAMQRDAAERLDLYSKLIAEIVAGVRLQLGARSRDKLVWTSIKAVYSGLIALRDDWELAETYFNSVTRRIFTTVGVDQQVEFVDTDFDAPPTDSTQPMLREYTSPSSFETLLQNILSDYVFEAEYEDRIRDARLGAKAIEEHLHSLGYRVAVERAEMLNPIFYRGKGAYLIGRMWCGGRPLPLVLALQNHERGIVLDAFLFTEEETSILFSFTRSYFHVEVARPYELVRFLQEIMPRKPLAEFYISIGYHRHGKTEMYRHLLHHLQTIDEQFIIAPGARGMVMLVFTLPSHDVVCKIIKDHFDDPKTSTRENVMANYYLVFKHDRVGRLIDAQEFEHLEFDRARFSQPLLEEMQRVAANTVSLKNDRVVINHLYIERRLHPLDMFVREENGEAVRAAVIDYGNAIKDLASANIFPGDILLKNFGVTRHGRVVFYDYDELCLLTDCHFRKLPRPRDEIERLSAEPWFYVGENDCFPSEFKTWLGLAEPWRSVFYEHHSDLYAVAFWRDIQARILAGEVIDILPYSQSKRLTK
jgi:isocitrate dehydrogenase kinase/phosphatase